MRGHCRLKILERYRFVYLRPRWGTLNRRTGWRFASRPEVRRAQSRKCEGRGNAQGFGSREAFQGAPRGTHRPPAPRTPASSMRRDVGWSWPEYGRGSTVRGTVTSIGVHRLVSGKPFSTPDLMIVRAPYVPVRPSATAPAKRTGRPRPHLLPITPVLDGLPSRRDFLRPQPHKKRQPLGPEIVKGRPSSRLLFRYFCTGGASRE